MHFCKNRKKLILDKDEYNNFINIDEYDFQVRHLNPSEPWRSYSPNAYVFQLYDPDTEEPTQVIKFCRTYTPCAPRMKLLCDRFEREISALKRVRDAGKNDHVIKIFEDAEEEISGKKFRYYTMELAKADLTGFINQEKLMPQQKFLLCSDIIKCINSLHDMGIYHRDIKPGNFLITEDDNWKIADLGLIDSREEDLAAVDDGQERAKVGPSGFLSPEALNRWLGLNDPPRIDDKSDVFQLARVMGVILQGDIFCGQISASDFTRSEDSQHLFEVMSGALKYNATRRFDISELRDAFLGRFASKYALA